MDDEREDQQQDQQQDQQGITGVGVVALAKRGAARGE